jgi:hypothetical protein
MGSSLASVAGTTALPQTLPDRDRRKSEARLAGILYLLAGLPAPFAYIFAPAKLMVPGDAAGTVARVVAAPEYLRVGVVMELVSAVLLIVAAAALHRLLESVNRSQSRLMLILASAAAPIIFADAVDQLAALDLARGAAGPGAMSAQLALLFMTLHKHGIVLAQIFWGLWLIPLGLLVRRSTFLPSTIGWLLLAGGSAYVLASLTALLLPAFAVPVAQLAALVGGIAEGSTIIWLIGWGVNDAAPAGPVPPVTR